MMEVLTHYIPVNSYKELVDNWLFDKEPPSEEEYNLLLEGIKNWGTTGVPSVCVQLYIGEYPSCCGLRLAHGASDCFFSPVVHSYINTVRYVGKDELYRSLLVPLGTYLPVVYADVEDGSLRHIMEFLFKRQGIKRTTTVVKEFENPNTGNAVQVWISTPYNMPTYGEDGPEYEFDDDDDY